VHALRTSCPISYNSCRDRHCPKCQTAARDCWIAARQKELLPTRYLHIVFTLPGRLTPLVLQNKKILYDLLFRTSAETLLEIARDPRHLGAEMASSVSCIRGAKNSPLIRMSIVWCRPAASHLIAPVGFVPATTTSFPRKCCRKFSRQVRRRSQRGVSKMANSTSTET